MAKEIFNLDELSDEVTRAVSVCGGMLNQKVNEAVRDYALRELHPLKPELLGEIMSAAYEAEMQNGTPKNSNQWKQFWYCVAQRLVAVNKDR